MSIKTWLSSRRVIYAKKQTEFKSTALLCVLLALKETEVIQKEALFMQ